MRNDQLADIFAIIANRNIALQEVTRRFFVVTAICDCIAFNAYGNLFKLSRVRIYEAGKRGESGERKLAFDNDDFQLMCAFNA